MGFDTPNQGDDVLKSGDVNHQQTQNRTHDGDDITPQSVTTESLGGERHFAGGFDGANADSRLDNALSKATEGDRILLESATYSTARTISTKVALVGTSPAPTGTVITGTWTLDDNVITVTDFQLNSGGQLTIDGNACKILNGTHGNESIQVNGDVALITQQDNVTITFSAGTSDGIVDGCTRTTVTDNGSNSAGDIV
jgi:aspartate 1-decarboxylase